MDYIKPLTNFPKDLFGKIEDVYNEIIKDVKTKKIKWQTWSIYHYAIHADAYMTDEISKSFKDIEDMSWDLYAIKKGTMLPHKDRARSCCLQIPLRVVEGAYTFSVKAECLPDLKHLKWEQNFAKQITKEKWVNKDAGMRWNYKPEFYDHYNGEFPYLQNASQPHGGTSCSDEDRHLFSINIPRQSYEEMVGLYKYWH